MQMKDLHKYLQTLHIILFVFRNTATCQVFCILNDQMHLNQLAVPFSLCFPQVVRHAMLKRVTWCTLSFFKETAVI